MNNALCRNMQDLKKVPEVSGLCWCGLPIFVCALQRRRPPRRQYKADLAPKCT